MASYDKIGKYYDLIMGDQRESARCVRNLLREHHPKARTLLDLGCGTGSILSYLAQHYEVAGIDLSTAQGLTAWHLKVFERMRGGLYQPSEETIYERSFPVGHIQNTLRATGFKGIRTFDLEREGSLHSRKKSISFAGKRADWRCSVLGLRGSGKNSITVNVYLFVSPNGWELTADR